MPLRPYVDECVDQRIVVGVRKRGIDLITAADEGLLGAADEEHIERAIQLNRTLLSADHDFLRLAHVRMQGEAPFPGLIFIQPATSVGAAIRRITMAAAMLDPGEMIGRIYWVP